MAEKTEAAALKRRFSRRLLKLDGVMGVGVERADGDHDYLLTVYVDDDGPATCAAVRQIVGDDAVRIVKSGTFRKQ